MLNSQPKVWYRRAINSRAFHQSNQKFVKRKHKFTWFRIILLYALSMFIIWFASEYNSMLALISMYSIVFALFIITGYFFSYYSDLILAAEFLSAVFASAARVNTTFCLIVKNDHTVLYADQGYYGIFGQSSKGFSPFEVMLSNSVIEDYDKERFINAVEEGRHMSCSITPKNQPESNYTLNVEVIDDRLLDESIDKFNPANKGNILTVDTIYKPSGFIVIKAYDVKYMFQQHYEAVFDTLSTPVFAVDENNLVKYANNSFIKMMSSDFQNIFNHSFNGSIENNIEDDGSIIEGSMKFTDQDGIITEKTFVINKFKTSDEKILSYNFVS